MDLIENLQIIEISELMLFLRLTDT